MKLSVAVRDGVRTELLDSSSLQHLEACRAINWSSTVLWQCRKQEAGDDQWIGPNESICSHLEAGYCEGPAQLQSFMAGFTTFQVDYNTGKLLNIVSNELFDIRRLALAPLMPMKVHVFLSPPPGWQLESIVILLSSSQTEHDSHSLFHAASLGFWGVHDRTALLSQAVSCTLADPKAQFLIYKHWSTETNRSTPSGTHPVNVPAGCM